MPIEKLRPSFTFDEDRLKELKKITPEAFADGMINWEVLRESLGEYLENESGEIEHFGLFWPGKKEARRIASIPSMGTLIPVYGEGLKADGTSDADGANDSHNIFIEGENLEVLKILQKSYAGRIKMIYIDPPYNTGNDFVYDDDFTEPLQEYLRKTGQIDDEGRSLTTNKKADGRFHSKWLSMMYPRLKLARNLLSDDGAIFVSIDDNEGHNLRLILNEIFGEENALTQFVWRTDGNFDNQAKIKKCHEYIMVYTKDLNLFKYPNVIDPSVGEESKLFKDSIRNTIVKNGPKNPISSVTLPVGFPCEFENGIIQKRKNIWPHYNSDAVVRNYKLTNQVVVESGWSSKNIFIDFINNNFKSIKDSKGQETTLIITKNGTIEATKIRDESYGHVITVLTNMGNTQSTTSQLEKEGVYFDYPKPVKLIKYLISLINDNSFICLDFFAGSGTVAEAISILNNEDNGGRNYILIQLPEPVGKDSKAKENNFKDVSTITKFRIRNVLKSDFRSFRLANSNFNNYSDFKGDKTKNLELYFEETANPLIKDVDIKDLILELLLIEGFPLDATIEPDKSFKSNEVQKVSSKICDHCLIICLDRIIKNATLDHLELTGKDIFICFDNAITDHHKLTLSDKGSIKTI
jgi:adenine-specific DNA-methyltransferase